MSGIIKLLPDHIANQIAAGEVVQRPASVVKELIENAIDAGATKVQVLIKDAGKTLIQVIDNGKGMNEADARLCFERHATSKVASADDLFNLKTKGFRGEALASIAAIAHVKLITRHQDNETGISLVNEGSKLASVEPMVCAVGTRFDVKNLFFNVPARRNFLKSDTVEFNHIVDEFLRVALPHPEIAFSLHHNDSEVYHLPSTISRKRIVDILGKQFNERLVPIEEETDIVSIKGYLIKPEFSKKSRGDQFFFVNNRFFRDNYFNHAVNKAFDGLIQPKHFAGYFIFFDIDASKIDVNVHPTKTEIKFEEDKFIYSILYSTIKLALGKYNIAPTLDFERETCFDIPHDMKYQPVSEPVIKVDTTYNPFFNVSSKPSSSISSGQSPAMRAAGFGSNDYSTADWQNFYAIQEDDTAEQTTLQLDQEDASINKQFLVKGNYIFTTCKSGLMVIDAQRAIERIVYDDLFNKFISSPINSQTLLFPIEKECSKAGLALWNSNCTLLKQLGFHTTSTADVLHIEGVPSCLETETIDTCVDLILESLSFKDIDKGEIAHVMVSAIAISASRKKQNLHLEEVVVNLIDQLFLCPEHAHTPSGKKIIDTIQLNQLIARF